MEPSRKSYNLEQVIKNLSGGVDRRVSIREDRCNPVFGCGGPATEFKDAISRKEFSISGLCQKCQDGVFGDPFDEDEAKERTGSLSGI